MTTASTSPAERARKIESLVLQRLAPVGTQAAIAAAIGKSESTITRLKSEHLGDLARVLAHLGLAVVPVEYRYIDPRSAEVLTGLLELASARDGGLAALLFDRDPK